MKQYADVRQALETEDLETARDLLRGYLEEEESAEAWYLAAEAAVNDKQRRYFLEKAVECDPLYAKAGNALHNLLHPEGIQQPAPKVTAKPAYDLASFDKRMMAFLIDHIMLWFVSVTIWNLSAILMGVTENSMEGVAPAFFLWVILSSGAYIGYFGYSFVKWNGQSFGKRLLGIRVIKENGQALQWRDAIFRCWLGYLISGAPLGLGFFWTLFDAQKRGWHDMIAETRVIKA